MILRKPYAFLIKNFRLIHTILTLCMIYLLYRSYKLHNFLNDTFNMTELTIARGSAEKNFNKGMFILPWIILVIVIILLVVMIRKKKPKLFYIANIALYVSLIATYNYLYGTILFMETNIVSAQTIKLAIDISFIITIVQLLFTIVSFVRSIGLDIKKFDFGKDLMELDVNEQDNEEFEVNVDVDTDSLKRKINKKFRYAKYIYVENMAIINTILIVILASIGFIVYLNNDILNVKYREGETFSTADYSFNIMSSYITQNNSKGKKITNDKTKLLILNTQINSYKISNKINLAKTLITIDGKKYYPVSKYSKDLLDLGVVYTNQTLLNGIVNYLLVYEIPVKAASYKISFKYLNDYKVKSNKVTPSYISVMIKPLDLDAQITGIKSELKEEYTLNKNITGTSNVMIKSIDIAPYYVNEYKYCFNINECYDSLEYIRPLLNTNYDKYIMKVSGEFNLDQNVNNYKIKNISDLIINLGKIEYFKGDNKYTINNFTKISAKKYQEDGIHYIEIPKDVYNADSAYLIIRLRNKEYKYVLF